MRSADRVIQARGSRRPRLLRSRPRARGRSRRADAEEVVEVDVGCLGLAAALGDQRDDRGQAVRAGADRRTRAFALEPGLHREARGPERRARRAESDVVPGVVRRSASLPGTSPVTKPEPPASHTGPPGNAAASDPFGRPAVLAAVVPVPSSSPQRPIRLAAGADSGSSIVPAIAAWLRATFQMRASSIEPLKKPGGHAGRGHRRRQPRVLNAVGARRERADRPSVASSSPFRNSRHVVPS